MKRNFRKHLQMPVEQKIIILGLRIETSDTVQCVTANNKLHLKDEWKLLIAYKPYDSGYQDPPLYMEKPILWTEEFEWISNTPISLATYNKPPKCTLTHLEEQQRFTYILNLTLEGVIEIHFDERPVLPVNENSAPAAMPTSRKEQENAETHLTKWKQIELDLEQSNKRIAVLEKQYSEVIDHLHKQTERMDYLVDLLEKKSITHSRISGYILDSFRLIPVSKTIVEFYLNNQDDAVAKIASDARGYYTCDQLPAGTYEIRVKHPRFSPLIIKDYIIRAGDNKYQDFLLRK